MTKKKTFIRAANALLFSKTELISVLVPVSFLILVVLPFLFGRCFKVELKENFRLPYVNRDNYYLYSRCAEAEVQRSSCLFLGDSAIWGMYASNTGTLPAQLNQLLGRNSCGNLAIDGLHPVAMKTLVENFGKSIRNRTVLIYFNPLWVNSAKYDLSGTEPYRVNHPELVPQFGGIASYDAKFDKKVGILLDRYIPFFAVKRHLQNCFYNNSDFKSYLIKNPSEKFFGRIRCTITPEEKEHKGSKENYLSRGIPLQHWDWVPLRSSRQFDALIKTARLLQNRGNRVYVMVGTINPGLLDKETKIRLSGLRKEAAKLLEENNIPGIMLPEIDAKLYADASHPLESGYGEWARFLKRILVARPAE